MGPTRYGHQAKRVVLLAWPTEPIWEEAVILGCVYHTRESNLSRLATQVTGTSTGAPHRSALLLDALRGMLVSAEALTIIDKGRLVIGSSLTGN